MLIAINACTSDDTTNEPPKVQPDTVRSLSFSYLGVGNLSQIEGPRTVTIKSDDQFTDNEWASLCNDVVTAIMRGYNKGMSLLFPDDEYIEYKNAWNKYFFEFVFNIDQFKSVATVVLSNTATYDCEVKENDYATLYLKTSALNTVDVQPAIWVMIDGEDGDGSYHHP